MRSSAFARSVSLFRQAVRWAWMRDEVERTTSREKVLYFAVLYGSWFALMLVVGLVVEVLGYSGFAGAIWIFGIWFSAFMASIDIAWEALNYWFDRRDERTEPRPGPDRELAWRLRPARDTWVGFVVTVVALVILVASFQLALFLTSLAG